MKQFLLGLVIGGILGTGSWGVAQYFYDNDESLGPYGARQMDLNNRLDMIEQRQHQQELNRYNEPC